MTDPLPLRIFLATPGDLEQERKIVRVVVDEFNNGRTSGGPSFEIVGWERTRGVASRPQGEINELIDESHFMIVLFKKKWGSAPGSPWGYTSGTEEELFTGLLALGTSEQPMRDIWVGFIAADEREHEVERLKAQFNSSHELMYESLADDRDLKTKLAQRLEDWVAASASKVVRHFTLLPSSGKEVLQAAKLRAEGEKLVELGQPTKGHDRLHQAAGLGGPTEWLALARYQARHGDLEDAQQSTQRAIDLVIDGSADLYSPQAAEAFAEQAGVLRRKGDPNAAVGRLEHALTLVDKDSAAAKRVKARLLDDLGLARKDAGNLQTARANFEESAQIRNEQNLPVGECQSLINLVRLDIAEKNFAPVADGVDRVEQLIPRIPASSLQANAGVLVAQVRLRQNRAAEGIDHAKRSLALNRQIANRRGEAISLLLLAQSYRALEKFDEARKHAMACLQVNQAMGDAYGAGRAQWFIDQLSSV